MDNKLEKYLYYKREHADCEHNLPNNDVGFRVVEARQGELYMGGRPLYHTIAFVLEGEIEMIYGDCMRQRFVEGDIFLQSQSSGMYGKSLTDCKVMLLSFNNEVEVLCDNCTLSDYKKSDADIDFVFASLRIVPAVQHFCTLMEEYLRLEMHCSYIHLLKQRELFLLFRYSYSRIDMVRFFFPLIGEGVSFRNKVFRCYHKGIGVGELARQFNMSETPFVAKFKAEFGLSPYQWMLKQRSKQIVLRLSLPETTINDIVDEFHFTDASHFLKYCKKQFGCTPNELAKKAKGVNL